MSNFILGFTGPRRSGKDYGADAVITELERRGAFVVRTSFAKALRELACAVTGMLPTQFDSLKDVPGQEFTINYTILNHWLRGRGMLPANMTATQTMLHAKEWREAIDSQCRQQQHDNRAFNFYFEEDAVAVRGSGRDVLIVLGQAARQIDPQFWVNILLRDISVYDDAFIVITDVRPANEAMICHYVIEVSSDKAQYAGTATESRLHESLVSYRVHNAGDATYGQFMRSLGAEIHYQVTTRVMKPKPKATGFTTEMFDRTRIKEL